MVLAMVSESVIAGSLRRQFSWILAGRLLGALIQAVSVALVARWSGPTNFGTFAVVYGLAVFVQSASDLGLTPFLTRTRAVEASDGYVGAALKLVDRICVGVGIIATAAIAIASYFDPVYFLLLPLGVWMASEKAAEAWLGIPLADGDSSKNALSLVGRRVGALGVLLITTALGFDAVLGFSIGLAISCVVAALVAKLQVRGEVVRGETHAIGELIRLTVPFWLNSMAAQARNLDTLLVSIFASSTQAGVYGVASRLTTPLSLVPQAFASVLMPAAARSGKAAFSRVAHSLLLLSLFTSVLYVAVCMAAPFIVPMALGPEFEDAVPIVQLICVGLVFSSIAAQFGALLQGWGHKKTVAVVQGTCTTAFLIGIVIVVPIWGGLGAGAMFSLSVFFQTVVLGGLVALAIRGDDVMSA